MSVMTSLDLDIAAMMYNDKITINNIFYILLSLLFLVQSRLRCDSNTSPVCGGARLIKSSLESERSCSPVTANCDKSNCSKLNSLTAHDNHCDTCSTLQVFGSKQINTLCKHCDKQWW